MSDKRKNNGGHSTKAKSPNDMRLLPKTDLQAIHERLEPFTDEAIQKHKEAIENGEKWAIELFYKYRFGMPTQVVQNDTKITMNNFDIKELFTIDKDTQQI